jgi:hypothetical protein
LKLVALFGAFLVASSASAQAAQEARRQPPVDRAYLEAFGSFPAPGSVHDVLACAGANELLWTDNVRKDPYSREANDAKRKAGWYSAVALQVFALESKAVLDAVEAARSSSDRAAVLSLARRCRAAPENWRE